MKILLCIDDTDSIDSMGTGELLQLIGEGIEEKGWGKVGPATRHQLLIHEDIPYTSHNSSMCFEAEVKGEYLQQIIDFAQEFLKSESAEGSDPGLCVVDTDALSDKKRLVGFGYMAKKQVLKKEDAYSLASDTGVHLSEHGGTGQGVIGALAGAGLRLGGNDGRLRGRLDAEQLGNPVEVKKLLSHEYIDGVEDLSGNSLNEGELVYIEDKVKTVLRGGRFVLLVTPLNPPKSGAAWKNCSKQRLKEF